jgi:hypothetical protein
MKRFAALFVVILMGFIGCEKNNDYDSALKDLLADLSKMGEQSIEDLSVKYSGKSLEPNRYNFVGLELNTSLEEFSLFLEKEGTKSNNYDSVLVELIKSNVSSEYLKLSEKYFTETENKIFEVISASLSSTKPEDVAYRIAYYEDIISKKATLRIESRERLLVFCAVYKSLFEFLRRQSSLLKSGTFDDCFRDKMYDIFTDGLVKKLKCVVIWPECLAIAAADCLIDML